jgi:hypothetical protein
MEHPEPKLEPVESPGTQERTELQGLSELLLGDLGVETPGQAMDPLLRAMLALC